MSGEAPQPNGKKAEVDISPTTESVNPNLEWRIKPLRSLVNCDFFQDVYDPRDDTTYWYVTIEWKEPSFTADGQVSLAESDWKKYTAIGPLNKRFLQWAEDLYRGWEDRAHVYLNIKKVEMLADDKPQSPGW